MTLMTLLFYYSHLLDVSSSGKLVIMLLITMVAVPNLQPIKDSEKDMTPYSEI